MPFTCQEALDTTPPSILNDSRMPAGNVARLGGDARPLSPSNNPGGIAGRMARTQELIDIIDKVLDILSDNDDIGNLDLLSNDCDFYEWASQ